MEETTNTTSTGAKGGVCPHEGHCCGCSGCGAMCAHKMRGYYSKHFIVLVIGVVLAFFVGMKLGEMKGWVMRDTDMSGRMHAWERDETRMMGPAPVSTTTTVAPSVQ